jgi:hypothetical protein
MTARYRFPAWARAHVGSSRPSEVKRYFDDRHVEHTAEFWRKFLQSKAPLSVVIGTWGPICDVAGLPLSAFIDWEPGEPPARTSKPRRAPRAKQEAPRRPAPPRPGDYFGDAHA